MADETLRGEIEILESIYYNEMSLEWQDNTCTLRFKLFPNTGFDEQLVYVRAVLTLVATTDYPERAPTVLLSDVRGLSEEATNSLHRSLCERAEELLGGEMLFELVELAKGVLTQNNTPAGDCSVCMCPFDDAVFLKTHCFHFFHVNCLAQYLVHAAVDAGVTVGSVVDAKAVCPICREQLTAEDLDGLGPRLDTEHTALMARRKLEGAKVEEVMVWGETQHVQTASGGLQIVRNDIYTRPLPPTPVAADQEAGAGGAAEQPCDADATPATDVPVPTLVLPASSADGKGGRKSPSPQPKEGGARGGRRGSARGGDGANGSEGAQGGEDKNKREGKREGGRRGRGRGGRTSPDAAGRGRGATPTPPSVSPTPCETNGNAHSSGESNTSNGDAGAAGGGGAEQGWTEVGGKGKGGRTSPVERPAAPGAGRGARPKGARPKEDGRPGKGRGRGNGAGDVRSPRVTADA